jgi:predicted nucleic acid-binding protein
VAIYALDANVLVSWVLPSGRTSAVEFFDTTSDGDTLIGSHLLLAEFTSVLRTEVFGRRLLHEEAIGFIEEVLGLALVIETHPRIYPRALELARRFQHKKAYDMQYLALAETTGAELVTMDRGLRHAATQVGVPVRFLP